MKYFALMNAAKWIIDRMKHTGTEQVLLTHEELAVILGVGRSYASRVLQGFRAEAFWIRAVAVTVRNIGLLHRIALAAVRRKPLAHGPTHRELTRD